ncbi:Chondroitinase-B precursor [Botrimarina colliarenosi]|uniref:Probable pectate lyase C n=1 Tax=Botrimarina colliarenosi TaxID=2528001 RepID=A0A5C6AJN8_9BACT|nr:chondroitinase-B domain-containing protein [Botrimarina colliarenosi]TWT99468.1 Chondroitinase-B precursor [Botrimarina colliarenosi]
MRARRIIAASFANFAAVALQFACVLSMPVGAAEFLVNSAAQITTAMQAAQPGDTVVMTDGIWTNQRISFAGAGASGAPITLRPQTPGGVTLNGDSTLSISGDWLVADGLNFEGGALASGNIVEFRGSRGAATNSRLTNSAIVNYNPASIDTRYFWVSLYGASNRVDHNYFSGQSHSGVTVTVWRDTAAADNHQIDNNYFGDRPVGNGNGFETIRIGDSSQSLSDSFTVVENNVFERTNGEIETISNKSGSNIFRYNTFRDVAGTLTLRHGNNSLVEGNFFLGGGVSGSGGVRVIGEGQTIVNNYFNDLDGRSGGAISISAGVPNSALNAYYQVKNSVIAHNTIIDVNAAAITFDDGLGSSGRTLLAENVTIANNLIWSTQDPLFEGNQGAGWNWEGNIAYGQSLGPVAGNPGVTVANPMLALGSDGLYRPMASSPSIDAAAPGYSSLITTDMDGQPRVGLYDVGADEFSTATIVRKPLTKTDVGPSWLGGNVTPPGGGSRCGLTGCALQAERYASILDPDGDGAVWTVATVAEALGGAVLRAPDGDRVDLPTKLHDTIATYDLEFLTPGVYTAYYRGRGFGGSSDSFYAPTGFGVDPTQNKSLTANGLFDWTKDATTFTITASNIGVPLELRLAMREQMAELDALVLSLDSALTDAELDQLFAVVVGDYNGDGLVDAADYSVWRDSLGQSGVGIAADGDGNGVVDSSDYTVWSSAYASAVMSPSHGVSSPEPTAMALGALSITAVSLRRYRTLDSKTL